MRLRKCTPFLAVGLLLLAAAVVLFHQHQLVYPTPDTKSAFFRQYSPERTAKPFFSEKRGSGLGEGESAGAGKHLATHGKDFDYHFIIRAENWMPLMNAVAEDMSEQLRLAGAERISFSGDPRQGFRYEYISGQAVGNATISPLEIPDRQQQPPKCMRANEKTARLLVSVREEWFKVEPGLMTVSVRSDLR